MSDPSEIPSIWEPITPEINRLLGLGGNEEVTPEMIAAAQTAMFDAGGRYLVPETLTIIYAAMRAAAPR